MEKAICIGCGIVAAGSHPFIGVGREDLDAGTGPMVTHPVCAACHRDPTHRTLRPTLKVTFFASNDAPTALRAARNTDHQSKTGQSIGIGGASV